MLLQLVLTTLDNLLNRFLGIFLLALASILVAWSIVSALGLIMNLFTANTAYGAGFIVAKAFAIILVGYLGFRAFKVGRDKLSQLHKE